MIIVLVNQGSITSGSISYNAGTGVVSISSPNWSARTTVPNGGEPFTFNFSGLGTPEAICIYPAL